MRIEQLEYLAAVNQVGSLRRASEHLHISQPALSEAVSKLERELGITLLDRRRSGARISRQGRNLLTPMLDVLAAVDRLKQAAGDEKAAGTVLRLGTVNAATSQVLIPALRSMRESHPATTVEVLDMVQAEIQVGLDEGTLDLGLVNVLPDDDLPINVGRSTLLRGRAVAVLPAGHPLAEQSSVTVAELAAESLVLMRGGYLMHRLVTRLFGEDLPVATRVTDGAEMGKLMVAEGVGATVLPDYSVLGDPLERSGAIVARPLSGAETSVSLVLLRRRDAHLPEQVDAFTERLVAHAREWRARHRPPAAGTAG